jgi:hypothetical protein
MFCSSGQEHFLLRARDMFLVSSPGPENIVHTKQKSDYFLFRHEKSEYFFVSFLTTKFGDRIKKKFLLKIRRSIPSIKKMVCSFLWLNVFLSQYNYKKVEIARFQNISYSNWDAALTMSTGPPAQDQ